MYNRPYGIASPSELIAITALADFYYALPIVSATLSAALLGSAMFKEFHIEDGVNCLFAYTSPFLIFEAQKLRHPVLFRECFIHVVAS
jgi:hypothetical protein